MAKISGFRSSASSCVKVAEMLGTLGLAVLAVGFAISATAQTYSIDWFKVSGGGGTSAGGVYSVDGTIGQHDAGAPMTGGDYSLTGGFWSLLSTIQTPGAPILKIFLTTTNTAVVMWPSQSAGFALEQNGALNTANWTTPAESLQDDGTNKFIIVSPPSGKRFYRLYKP